MKKRRLLSVLPVICLLGAVLAGCGSSGSGSGGAAEPTADASGYVYTGEAPVTKSGGSLKILASTSNYSNVDISNAPIVKRVFEEAGVTPEWQLLDFNSYVDAITPMLASGQVDADIVKLPDSDPNQVYLKSGMFVPLDTYFGIMPNFSAWLEAHPAQKAELTAEDGHIYYVPGTYVAHDYQPCLMYNQVWLDQAGVSAPENLEDFVALLRYYQTHDMNGNGDPNDEIPMSIMNDFLPYMFGPAFGLDLVSGFQADAQGHVSYAFADAENYRAYLEFLHGLYAEGLLEVEFTSLDRDQVISRIAGDLTGVAFDFSWAMSMMYSNVLPYYDGSEHTAFVGAPPLSGPSRGFYVGRNLLSDMFGVNASSEKIELAVKFLDFAMSDHCQDYYQWGFEGETYTVNADGSRSYTEQALNNDWLQAFGINPAFVFPAQQSVEATDILVAPWHARINGELRQYVRDPWPAIYATTQESDTVNLYLTDLQTNVAENATAFINGTKDLNTDFDAYLSGLESLNLGEVTAIRQKQYDRYRKALGQ
ncbi:MAG: extracellular solute-binding protein [Lachnospiraceae bacterium]|nr:extracellular solute-binding protein [Lachnospiraceae bacterium]